MVSRKYKVSVFTILNYIFMILVMIVMIYPFLYVITMSLLPIEELNASKFILFPTKITFYPYKYVFAQTNLGRAYYNTIFITIMGVLFYLTLTTLAGYALSNKELPGRKFMLAFLIFTMMFGGGLIPYYILIKNLGLINSIWALIIPTCGSAYWIIITRNFFSTIPESLKESARLDGCSEFRIFGNIIIPLSLPIISTLALFHAVGQWNTYFNAVMFTSSQKLNVLQIVIRAMYQNGQETLSGDNLPPPLESIRSATIMAATLPILLIYPFLQKYFVKGMMVGSIKG